MKTLVIAECGSCHDRRAEKALRLIDAAAKAGCSIAKFQFWSDAEQLAARRRVPLPYREIYRKYRMPEYWLHFLKDRCDQVGIEFMCSTYLPQDVATVAPFVKRFKIASFEAGDDAFLEAHLPHRKPLIVSFGMSDTRDVQTILDRFSYPHLSALLCVSTYPAPPEAYDLRVLHQWRDDVLGLLGADQVGLSDHSRHPMMGALAVAAGAEIIEAHLRLDDTDPQNPDYATAFSPAEFADYVRNIRFAETVMGDGVKRLQDCEREMAQFRVGGPQ